MTQQRSQAQTLEPVAVPNKEGEALWFFGAQIRP